MSLRLLTEKADLLPLPYILHHLLCINHLSTTRPSHSLPPYLLPSIRLSFPPSSSVQSSHVPGIQNTANFKLQTLKGSHRWRWKAFRTAAVSRPKPCPNELRDAYSRAFIAAGSPTHGIPGTAQRSEPLGTATTCSAHGQPLSGTQHLIARPLAIQPLC